MYSAFRIFDNNNNKKNKKGMLKKGRGIFIGVYRMGREGQGGRMEHLASID